MPIATFKPTEIPSETNVPKQDVMVPEDKIFKPASVDTSLHAPESLVVYMEGKPWTVDKYYSRIMTLHDELKELDIGQNAAHQQYQEVLNLEFRVQSSLNFNYDAKTALSEVTGDAVIGTIIPNRYDYFVAETSTHGRSLFMITMAEPLSYMSKTVYKCSYTLVGHEGTTEVDVMLEALEARKVTSYYFHKERIDESGQGLLTKNQHELLIQIQRETKRCIGEFVRRFYDVKNKTLDVPTILDHMCAYDHRAIDFFFKIVEQGELPRAGVDINRIRIRHPEAMALPSLYDAIIDQTVETLNEVAIHKVGIVNNRMNKLSYNPSMNYVGSWKPTNIGGTETWFVDRFIAPVFSDENRHCYGSSQEMLGVFTIEQDNTVEIKQGQDSVIYYPWNTHQGMQQQFRSIFNQVHHNGYYVLSESFYKQSDNPVPLSLLELTMLDYLHGRQLNREDVLKMLSTLPKLPRLEAFYYYPLVIFLGKQASKRVF